MATFKPEIANLTKVFVLLSVKMDSSLCLYLRSCLQPHSWHVMCTSIFFSWLSWQPLTTAANVPITSSFVSKTDVDKSNKSFFSPPLVHSPLMKPAVTLSLCNSRPSQVDSIKEPETIWRCDYVAVLIWPALNPADILPSLLMPHSLFSLFSPPRSRPSLRVLLQFTDSLLSLVFFSAGSTCRTGSPRTSIYNRFSIATAWH